MWLTKWVW